MAVSKVNAEEYTQTLAQHMVASWRQIMLADQMGVPTALGYDSLRDWVNERLGGYMRLSLAQRLEALKELEAQGYTRAKIYEITGVSETVQKKTHRKNGQVAGSENAEQEEHRGETGQVAGYLEAEVEKLTANAKAMRSKHADEVKALKEKVRKANKTIAEIERNAIEKARKEISETERKRLTKEAEAFASEMSEKVAVGMSVVLVHSVCGALTEAGEGVKQIVESAGGVTSDQLSEIESAHAGFLEELNIARMAERSS